MEIKVTRDELYRALSRVQSIVEKRTNMPILSMVLLSTSKSEVYITATDLEISLQQKIPANIISTGSVTISGRKLFEILKESKKAEIHIKEKENNRVFITDQQARYNLGFMPPDEYPVFVEPENVTTAEVPSKVLREMIAKTIYAVTLEEAGFKLSGTFLEKVVQGGKALLRMVATDGHRLSLIDKEMETMEKVKFDGGVMIPKKGMSELAKLASEDDLIHLGFKGNNCVAKTKNSIIVIRLLESKFPDYNAVIPKKAKSVVKVDRDLLLDGMKKMLILATESYRGVKIILDKGSMELISINPDLGEAQETLAVEYKGQPLEAGFNARYFIDVLQNMESEKVEVGFIDNSSPCTIYGEKDQGFLGLIMPMRL